MFIHEMTTAECCEQLEHTHVGRLACARNNQPYIVPMNFVCDGSYSYLYGFTTLGQKVEWMRENPLVCFEVDNVVNQNNWTSVVIFGRYEELPDTADYEATRRRAHAFLQTRAMWWEPAYISQEHRDSAHSVIPIFFRIKIESMTGHRANSDDAEAGIERPDLEVHSDATNVPKSKWGLILKAAVVYFALVFSAGSVLGPIRILLVVPRLGERLAELLEAPLMLIVIVLAANWIVRKFHLPPILLYRLGAGLLALALGLLFELGLVLKLRGLTLTEYFATRDTVAATVYYFTLVLFAIMPLLMHRKTSS